MYCFCNISTCSWCRSTHLWEIYCLHTRFSFSILHSGRTVISCSTFEIRCGDSLFLGKILNDDQPLTEYKIDEKGFVVVMVTKVKILSNIFQTM